jgi:early secretory antigenic target protein ESAT-6
LDGTLERRGSDVVASGEISVKFADIEDAGARVRAVAAAIEQLLGDLAVTLRPIAAEWTGEAAANYQYEQHQWQTAADDLHTVLLQIATVLDTSHITYHQAETDLHRLWGAQ